MADLIDLKPREETEGLRMKDEELFEVFGDFDPRDYEDEARQRWGRTGAYRESARRTRRYGKAEWHHIKEEGDRITSGMAALLDEGAPPDHPRAGELVQAHRAMISRWFYPCSPRMQAALAEMYVGDERFRQTYDAVRPGLAAYVRDAIMAGVENMKPE